MIKTIFKYIKNTVASSRFVTKEIRPFLSLMLRYRFTVAGLFFTSIMVSLLEACGIGVMVPILEGLRQTDISAMPFPMKHFSGLFIGIDLVNRIRIVAVLMVGIVALKGIFSYFNVVLGTGMQVRIVKQYREMSFSQLLKLGMGYINRRKAGEIQTLIINFPGYVGALAYNFAILLPQLFTVLVFVSILIILSWQLTITAMLILMGASLLLNRVVVLTKNLAESTTNSYIQINNLLLESFSGIKVTHLFSREKELFVKFEGAAEDVRKNEYNLNRAKIIMAPTLELLATAGLASIMLIGSFVMGKFGTFSIEMLMLFIYVLFRLVPHVLKLNQARIDFAGNIPFIRKVFAFLDTSDKPYIHSGRIPFLGLQQGIELRDVKFSYVLNENIVLRDFNIFITKGSRVGIVGPSGAGKSTITEILLRFYDPEGGAILVDGVDLKELNLVSWRRRIGVVTQDTFLFNDTVRNNIAYALPEATREQVEWAAKRAHAYEFICSMPLGYDTVLGERGVLLSGGQRQRIAIARAILTDPEILIFDEATSALDTQSEKIVQEALNEVGKGKTVITIAHRLSTVSDADVIFVIESGRVVQQGDHNNLLQTEGLYKELVKMQSLGANKNE